MKIILKNITELFEYLMYDYIEELENISTKNGIQKRLKNSELEQELKNKIKECIQVKDLVVELKLGPNYNRTESPWIQIYTKENRSGARGRYVGISFVKESNDIEIWIGFGKTGKKQAEILELEKEYKIKYSLIETDLKYGFEYNIEYCEAIIIIKKININNFEEKEFAIDLEYITDLYKTYEVRYENAMIPLKENKYIESISENKITYEEINRKMLVLIEEVGNLAKAI